MPGQEQGKRRLVALPNRLLTDVRDDAALRVHFHRGGFVGAGPGGVQVEPEAEILFSAPRRGSRHGATRRYPSPPRASAARITTGKSPQSQISPFGAR